MVNKKIGINIFIVLILVYLLMLYFVNSVRLLVFENVHDSKFSINDYSVVVDKNWYPSLSSEDALYNFFYIKEKVVDSVLLYYFNTDKNNRNFIQISVIESEEKVKLNDFVKKNQFISSYITGSNEYFLMRKWNNPKKGTMHMFYIYDVGLIITVNKENNLKALKFKGK